MVMSEDRGKGQSVGEVASRVIYLQMFRPVLSAWSRVPAYDERDMMSETREIKSCTPRTEYRSRCLLCELVHRGHCMCLGDTRRRLPSAMPQDGESRPRLITSVANAM